MNIFTFRIPSTQELQTIISTLSKEQLDELHFIEDDGKRIINFQLTDNVSLNTKEAFRPVLDAADMTDLSCITDGTVIQMGAIMLNGRHLPIPTDYDALPKWPDANVLGTPPLGLDPFTADTETPISWVKCGNLLMADRNLFENISHNQLCEVGLVQGTEVRMPFDKAVSQMFYKTSMQQPESSQRRKGDVMRDMALELDIGHQDCPVFLDHNALYTLADKIYDCWLSSADLTLADIVLSVSNMIRNGLEAFYWKENDKGYIEDFSSEAVKKVLLSCNLDVFTLLVEEKCEMRVNYALKNDNGKHTSVAKAVHALQATERALERMKKASLDTQIAGAALRRNPQQTGREAPTSERDR